ncbi:MAG: hypothetical protein RLZZ306_97 [Bacteroidota bacterium]
MKKLLLFLALIFIMSSRIHAQGTSPKEDTTISKTKLTELENTILNLKSSNSTLDSVPEKAKSGDSKSIKLGFWQWLIVWMPVILFLFLFLFLLTRLRKEGFLLADALSSCVPIEVGTITPAIKGILTIPAPADPANPLDPKSMMLLRSSSRLIAFMSGLTAIVISITLMTFYFYDVLSGTNTSQTTYLDSVWKIIVGLGIGVLPYGFNMIKEAQKA